MDTSDPLIKFDERGICHHCHDWERQWANHLELKKQFPDNVNKAIIDKTPPKSEFHVIMGLSGGADSSWAYHLARSMGIRILPIHFDNGYDLPVATENVKRLTEHWGDELQVIKLDMDEYHNLQIAFLKSGTTGLEIPTDHAIKAVTYQTARNREIPTILNGTNIATESHGTVAWTQGHADWKYIKGIGEIFGVKLQSFPHYTLRDNTTWMKQFWWLNLLDYTDYNREKAIAELSKATGYVHYGFKHGESRITRFLHGYIIPRRFGWDTRRSRVSAMVMSGQLTREAGLEILAKPVYTPELLEEDRGIILKTMGVTDSDFEEYMKLPLKSFWDYPSYTKTIRSNPILRAARYVYKVVKV